MNNEDIILLAKKAMLNSYSPYSNFSVGASLLCSDGSVYTGCNIENVSFGATICAERTAIFKAISEGHRNFIKLGIVSSNNDLTFPCGICLQVMLEFMYDSEIVLEGKNNSIKVFKVNELLPSVFNNFCR